MSRSNADRMVLIAWPTLGTTVRVQLLPEQAPQLTHLIWEALPLESLQSHALLSGYMLFATTRISTIVRENVMLSSEMPEGTCYFANGSQNLEIIYGPISEPEGQSVWGRAVPEDRARIKAVGQHVWRNLVSPFGNPASNPLAKQIIPVRYMRADEDK